MNKLNSSYILPIGSIVFLKDGDIPLMVVGRAQLFNNKGDIGYFDYAAVLYPLGIDESQEFAFFNHEDIEKVQFEGYRDSGEIEFANNYQKNIDKINYPKLLLKDL